MNIIEGLVQSRLWKWRGDLHRSEAGPYVLMLLIAVLLALALRICNAEDYQNIDYRKDQLLDLLRFVFGLSFWLQLIGFSLLPLFGLFRKTLIIGACFVSGINLTNLLSEALVIYRLDIGSYDLLLASLLLYGSLTLNFLVWYWLVDQPPRGAQKPWTSPTALVSMPYGIVFPEEVIERDLLQSENWKPSFTDYLYFTILSSNCFGPPEGHLLVGLPIKRLHIMHSVVMISVFIVILARAINTLR